MLPARRGSHDVGAVSKKSYLTNRRHARACASAKSLEVASLEVAVFHTLRERDCVLETRFHESRRRKRRRKTPVRLGGHGGSRWHAGLSGFCCSARHHHRRHVTQMSDIVHSSGNGRDVLGLRQGQGRALNLHQLEDREMWEGSERFVPPLSLMEH